MRPQIPKEVLAERERLARNLRHILTLREYNNSTIAEVVGMKRQAVFKVWRSPTEFMLLRIAKALGISWDLVEHAEERTLAELRG